MSCALHQIGFRAIEKIMEASFAAEDMHLRAHLTDAARDIQDKLFNYCWDVPPPTSPHETADLQEHLQDLERVIRGQGPWDQEDVKQKIGRFVEEIDKIILQNR